MNDTIMPHTRQKVKKNQYGIIIPQISAAQADKIFIK